MIQSPPMMDYFDFNMQLPDQWSDTDSERTLAVPTPVSNSSSGWSGGGSRAAGQIGTPTEKSGERGAGSGAEYVSYAFHPCATSDGFTPDLILKSLDHVLFHVHYHRILSASDNSFAMLCQAPLECSLSMYGTRPPTVVVPECSDVLNITLHAVYGMSALGYCPSFETVSSALDSFPRYGLSAKLYATAGQPLYDLVVSCAPHLPIDTYALAAAHDLADAAATASAHLLSFSLPTLSDELAVRMGPVYLKKLFFLHLGRMDALKRVLIQPPSTHSETPECSTADQKRLTRAWALTAVHVLWDAGPSEFRILRGARAQVLITLERFVHLSVASRAVAAPATPEMPKMPTCVAG